MEFLVIVMLAVAAVAVVAYPLVYRGRPRTDEAMLDAEVDRYRSALREGTLCQACLAANVPGSRFCAECGEPLAAGGLAGPTEWEASS